MRRLIPFFILALLLIAIPQPAGACEPCMEVATFDEAVEAADLIIVGQKVADGPSTGDGPDWITVQVIDVLKGEVPAEHRIRVNSWDGMCLYGIPADNERKVMLLEEGSGIYNAVMYGCAISQYLMQGELVLVEDQSYALDEFVMQLGPDAQIIHLEEPSALDLMLANLPIRGILTLLIPLCVVGAMAVGIIGGYVYLKRRESV